MTSKYYYSDGTISGRIDYSKTLHRKDGPAVELANGTKSWRKNGDLHRTDGPAVEYSDGTKEWMIHGKHHREDGPAYENPNGTRMWYINGVRLKKLTKKLLINYIKANNLTLSHLLTDPDPIVREAANKFNR